jgi:hypothetical protein
MIVTVNDFIFCHSQVLLTAHGHSKSEAGKQLTKCQWDEVRVQLVAVQDKTWHEQSTILLKALDVVLSRAHVIGVEFANAKVQSILPVLCEHGISYERTLFERALASGSMDATLPITNKFLELAFKNTVASTETEKSPNQSQASYNHIPNALQLLCSGDGPTYVKFIQLAVLDLALQAPSYEGADGSTVQLGIPEVLHLDAARFVNFRRRFASQTREAALLVTVFNFLSTQLRDVGQQQQKSHMLHLISDILHKHPPSTLDECSSSINMVCALLEEYLSKDLSDHGKALLIRSVAKNSAVLSIMVGMCASYAWLCVQVMPGYVCKLCLAMCASYAWLCVQVMPGYMCNVCLWLYKHLVTKIYLHFW